MRSPWRSLGEEKPIRTVKEDEQRRVPGDRGGTARRGEARQGVCGDRDTNGRGQLKTEERLGKRKTKRCLWEPLPPEAIVTLTRVVSEDRSCNA